MAGLLLCTFRYSRCAAVTSQSLQLQVSSPASLEGVVALLFDALGSSLVGQAVQALVRAGQVGILFQRSLQRLLASASARQAAVSLRICSLAPEKMHGPA